MAKAIEIFGWYGVGAILLGFALVSFGILDGTDLLFQALNVTGALGIGIHSWTKRDYQPTVLNIVWLLVAVIAIMKILLGL